MGEDGILANTVFSSLADLRGKKLGADKEFKAYAQLGFNIVSVSKPDMYEALARGVCDALPFAIEAVASNRWHEKAKCYMYNSSFHGGFQITVNLDTWNKLPADIQEIFMTAAADTEVFSMEWDKRKTAEYEQILKDAGLIVGRLPESDSRAFLKLSHQIDKEDMLAIAEKVGKAEEAKIILKYFDELLGTY
jgi:TRAP-type C4-dicarboxylate transport system substrate-binding protein